MTPMEAPATGMAGSSAAPAVRVMMVNYNAGPHLRRAVECLLAQSFRDFDCVLVDNGSTDGSLTDLPTDPRLTIVQAGANLGFAAANNLAARGARGRWLVALNPDAFAAPDWLERLVAAMEGDPRLVMAGSTQILADTPDRYDGGRYDGTGDNLMLFGFGWRGLYRKAVWPRHPDGECFAPCAAAAIYDRAAFEAAGGFDERFFCYGEDLDLAFRLRLAGGLCRQVGGAVVHHVGSATAQQVGGGFALYHGYRNQIWMLVKDMPGWLLPLSLILHAGLVLALILWSLKRGGAMTGPILRGVRDGLAGLPAAWRQRKAVQATRRVSTGAILSILGLNPVHIVTKPVLLRPVGSPVRVTPVQGDA